MERAGSQRKRPNVWRIPGFPRYETTNTPSKTGFEKRRLSLRSENTTTTEATKTTSTITTTPQSSSSLSRQATGLSQKQPGKENESPFVLLDHAGKLRVTITNSTTKRKKSSNSTNCITNSEKKIIRRRLSGDYEEQLSSNKLYRANPIRSIVFSSRAARPIEVDGNNRYDLTTGFFVYNDGNTSTTSSIGIPQAAGPEAHGMVTDMDFKKEVEKFERVEGREVNEAKAETSGADNPCSENFKNDPSNVPRDLFFLRNSYQRYKSREGDRAASICESPEEKVNTEGSSATRQWTNGPELFASGSAHDQEISGAEFRIERIDCNGGRVPAMNKFRKVKSGSDIGRLNVPLRRGDDISPLKRRMNQLKKSAMIVGRSCGIGRKGANAPAVTGAASARGYHVSNSKIGVKSMEEVRKLVKPTVSCFDQTKKWQYDHRESTVDPETEAIKKTSRGASPEVRGTTENISTSEEAELQVDKDQIASQSTKDSTIPLIKDDRDMSITDVFKSLSSSTRKKSAAGDRRLSEQLPISCTSTSLKELQEEQQQHPIEPTAIDETASILKIEKLIPRFCRPTLRDKSSDLKDDFIEFVYDDPVDNRQYKLKSKCDIFRDYSPLCNITHHPIIATPAVAASRPIEQQESTEEKPSSAGRSRTKVDVSQLDIGVASNDDSRFDRKIDTESRGRDRNLCDTLHAAFAKFKNNSKPPPPAGIELIKSTARVQMQTVIKRHPAVGSIKITRGEGITGDRRVQWAFRNGTTANETAAASPTLYPGEANNRLPVTDENKVRPNRKVGSDQESRTIKFAGKISELFRDIPLEIQFTTDYTEETIDVEDAREGYCYKISKTFLKGRAVTPEQRRIVVNFIISVHAYLLTSSSTLYQATKMFDAILDIKDVSVKELQLVALGALWIAIKNMETRIPTASEMISFAKDMYHAEGPGLLCKCERKILKTLGFNIRFPDPFYMSAYHLQQWSSLETPASKPSILRTIYHCASYLMDVALLDENYSGIPGELMAAAATQTAARLVLNASWEHPVDPLPWNNEKSTRCTQEEINRVVGPLLDGVLDSAEKDSQIGAVYKKYKNSRFDNTSDYLVMKIKKLPGPARANEN